MSRVVWLNLKLNSIHRVLYEDCHNTKQASTQCISPLILNFQVHPPVKWTFVMDTIVFSVFTLCAIALWLNDNQNWASSLIFLIVLLQLPTTIVRMIFFVKFLFASELWTNYFSSIIQINRISLQLLNCASCISWGGFFHTNFRIFGYPGPNIAHLD